MSPINHADLWQRVDRAIKIHDVHCRTMRIDSPEALPSPPVSAPARQRMQRPVRAGVMQDCTQRAGELVRGFLRSAPVRAAQLL
jgi:hypothetical protein